MEKKEDRGKFIEESGAIVSGHFVYKAGYKHGNLYVDKEQFSFMGAVKFINLIERVVKKALNSGLDLGDATTVGIMAPAYGALSSSLALAAAFEGLCFDVKFFPARTELVVEEGRKVHIIPDKLLARYQGSPFIIHEDIVNNGTTIGEVVDLLRSVAEARVLAVTCFMDRTGLSKDDLGVEQYFPYYVKKMEQYDVRKAPCPMCAEGVPLTTDLAKGTEWVAMFGQPPYPEGMDFSAFWS